MKAKHGILRDYDLMANGFSRAGLIDAGEGCTHYALMLLGMEGA